MASIGKIVEGECKEFANDADLLVLSKEIIENAPITFNQATELANVQPEDSISVALGKLSKLYETLEQDKINVQDQIDSKEIFRGYKLLNSEGWYKIFRFGASNSEKIQGIYGDTILLQLSQDYSNKGSEAIQMAITIGSPDKVDFNILSMVKNTNILTHVRIVYDTVDACNYLEVRYASTTENGVSYKVYFNSTKNIDENIAGLDFEPINSSREVVVSQIQLIKENTRSTDVRNGIREIVTGDITLQDYMIPDCIGSYGHYGGKITDLPSNVNSIGIFDTMYSIGDGDYKYIRQNYIPFDQNIFLSRYLSKDTNANPSTWSEFYPNGVVILPNGTDLNTLLTTMNAFCTMEYTYNHSIGRKVNGFLEVLNYKDGETMQRFSEYNTNRVYIRYHSSNSSNTWSPWRIEGGVLTIEQYIYGDSSSTIYNMACYMAKESLRRAKVYGLDKDTIYEYPMSWVGHNYFHVQFKRTGDDGLWMWMCTIENPQMTIKAFLNYSTEAVSDVYIYQGTTVS